MYRIRKSIDVDFAHIVEGHPGACINLHGHTWKMEVELGAQVLDDTGFVVDFGLLKREVLEPVHELLDHSLALSQTTYSRIGTALNEIGTVAFDTRKGGHHPADPLGFKHRANKGDLNGARQGLSPQKVSIFPFSPTSERLAYWLYGVALGAMLRQEGLEPSYRDMLRVKVLRASVYETLHPVHAVASYEEN